MKVLFYLLVFVSISLESIGQDLSLDSCQSMARRNHPFLKQLGILDQLTQLKQQNEQILNLPQFDFTARASWQSDVTKIPLNIPGVQPLSKDQYKAYIDIRQKIFDGGLAKKKQELEEADRLVSRQQTESDLYKIRETVNSLFFTMLILQENKKMIVLKRETLEARIRVVTSAVKNGATLPNELDQLLAERLLTDQQETELSATQQVTLTLLEIITGSDISAQAKFIVPALITNPNQENFMRPEIVLFELQQKRLEKNEALIRNSRKPYAYGFGQAGYGRPGLNMLNNNFADWYMFGAGLNWNIWDWHKSFRERAEIKLQKDLISINRENLTRSFLLALKQEENNFQKFKQLISSDEQIVVIKEQISRRSAAALENGAMTSADYIRDLNGSLQSKANLETHRLQLIQSTINIQTIQGKP